MDASAKAHILSLGPDLVQPGARDFSGNACWLCGALQDGRRHIRSPALSMPRVSNTSRACCSMSARLKAV